MLTAPQIGSLLRIYDRALSNPESYNKIVKEKLDKLYNLLSKIEPQGDDELRILYFSVERGSIENYGDFEKLKEYEEVSSYEEFENNFKEDYPDEICWYKMISSSYENYRAISINSKSIIYADMQSDSSPFENRQLRELIDFLISKVEECIKMLEDGTYNDYIHDNFSYKNRFGVIKRSDYWTLYRESKEHLLKEISQKKLTNLSKMQVKKNLIELKKMTSGKYFECVRLAYENNGYDLGNMTDKELYLKYADGRDEGLSKLEKNDNQEFDTWYNESRNCGGHPWEIMRGHSFARVNLVIRHDDDGYYLSLDGSVILRKIEITKIFLALSQKGIPIQIYDVETLKNAFRGDDYIGIVPDYILPIKCESYFKTYNPTEFVHLEDKMFKYIEWEELEKVYIKIK